MGRQVVVAAGGYLALLVLSLLAFIAAPAIVLPAFVVLSAWHFGLPLGGLAVAVALVPLIRGAVRAARCSGWRAAVADALDASVITLLGLTTNPLFSVGVFFLCWHAWREMPHVASDIAGSTSTREAAHHE
jgi:hypothetical protein